MAQFMMPVLKVQSWRKSASIVVAAVCEGALQLIPGAVTCATSTWLHRRTFPANHCTSLSHTLKWGKKWKKSSKSNRKLEQPPTEGQSPFKFAKKWAAEWLHQPRASTSHHCLSEKSIISPGCVCRKWWGFSLKSLPLVLYNHAYLHICIYLYIQTI